MFELKNKSAREVSDLLRKTVPSMIKTINSDAEMSGKNAVVLTFVYYLGYGTLDDQTCAIMNFSPFTVSESVVKIEEFVEHSIGSLPNTMAVFLANCGREKSRMPIKKGTMIEEPSNSVKIFG